MEGRKEKEKMIDKRIDNLLEHAPIYMNKYRSTLNSKSHTTQYSYINYVLDFLEYINRTMIFDISDLEFFKEIKKSDIDTYITSMNGKNSIKASRLYGIKSFFEFLLDDGYIESNPCDRIKVPKDKEEHVVTYLTKEEIDQIKGNIMSGCGNEMAKQRQKKWVNRDYAIIMLSLSLGLRVSSLCEINIEDIDFDKMEIKVVEKGNKIRYIPFSKNTEDVIKKWLNDREHLMLVAGKESDALFISRLIKRMATSSITDIVNKYTYNIDKHISPHKLRSTCATNVYNNTGDIYLTAYLLGHNNVNTTRRYVNMSEENKKKAATAMDNVLY